MSGSVGGSPGPVIRVVEAGGACLVAGRPLEAAALVDGVQASLTLVREHRPLAVAWAAAGAVTRGGKLLAFHQDVALICSYRDDEYARQIAGGLRVDPLDEALPWEVEAAIAHRVREARAALERQVLGCTPGVDGVLVVDGSIRGYDRDDVIGVVKSTATPWLTDTAALPYTLGWRSPAFAIPAARRGERDVFSAYVRLRTPMPHRHPWSYGLIRVEVLDVDQIDAACALALADRQPEGSADRRADVHLTGMHRAESVLRAYLPAAFTALG